MSKGQTLYITPGRCTGNMFGILQQVKERNVAKRYEIQIV